MLKHNLVFWWPGGDADDRLQAQADGFDHLAILGEQLNQILLDPPDHLKSTRSKLPSYRDNPVLWQLRGIS